MSQNFRFRSDDFEENDIGQDVRNSGDGHVQSYLTDGTVRNISFVLPNGESEFLNYAYLVSVKCSVAEDQLILKFTSETVILRGMRLKALYSSLMHQHPMEITCQDARYNATVDPNLPIVNEIIITD